MPETLRLLIENWAKENSCNCYDLQTGYLTKQDLQKGSWNYKNAIVFVYGFRCNGIITDTSKLTGALLDVKSIENYIQYKDIVNIIDNGSIQRAESDFCFRLQNGVTFKLSEGSESMFSKIYNCSLHYVVLQPNCTC